MQFSIVTWNIHGKNPVIKTRLSRIIPELEKGVADVICLQEAREAKIKLDTVPRLLEYAKVIPETESNHNVVLSRHQVLSSGELAFTVDTPLTLENALWVDIAIGNTSVRIYNCHFGIIGFGPSTRREQLRAVLTHAEKHDGPAIICGDLNTAGQRKGVGRVILRAFHISPPGEYIIEGEDLAEEERYMMARIAESHGFREAADLTQSTWRIPYSSWEPFSMKLDWMLVRGIDTPRVSLLPYISDHRAIHADCVIQK